MNFETYLNERTKEKLTEEYAIELIKTQCKNINLNWPLYRGMSMGHPYQLIDASNSFRTSANTSNYYTVLIDHFLHKSDYPLRSKSIICSTNRGYANMYVEDHIDDNGLLYVIVPYDSVSLGVCPKKDIWDNQLLLGDKYYNLNNVNDLLSYAGVPENSYDDILNYLISDKWNRNNHQILAKEFPVNISKESANDKLSKLYSSKNLNFSLIKNDEISTYKNNEVWFSGKCIAIAERKWKNIVATLKINRFQ